MLTKGNLAAAGGLCGDGNEEPTQEDPMTFQRAATAAFLASAILAAGCANTIRGVGQDTANAVNATQSAGKKVEKAAE